MVDSNDEGHLEEISDESLKIHQLVNRQGDKAAKGKRAVSLVLDLFKASMMGPLSSHTEGMPMLTLKHRWMKNRNLTSGSTTVSFNADGVAKVQDIGNARLDCEQLCRRYSGLIEFVTEEAPVEPPKAPEAPKKVEEPPKAPEAPKKVEEPPKEPEVPEKVEEPPKEPEVPEKVEEPVKAAPEEKAEPEAAAPEKAPPVKKAPPKRKK